MTLERSRTAVFRGDRIKPASAGSVSPIAFAYMLYTLDSAYRYARGQGGRWKGRVQANATSS